MTRNGRCCGLEMPAVIKLARPGADKRAHAEEYLKAAGELLFTLFAIGWTLTSIYQPEFVKKNPLKDRLGYNSLCVGIDTIPSVWLAQILFVTVSYLCLRYSWLDFERATIKKRTTGPAVYHLTVLKDLLFTISICVFALVFVIGPEASAWGHTLAFIQYILVRFVCVWTSFVQATTRPTRAAWRFLYVYGFISVAFPVALVVNYHKYDEGYPAPYINAWYTMCLDYGWFLCLALTSVFMPKSEEIRMVISLDDQNRQIVHRPDDYDIVPDDNVEKYLMRHVVDENDKPEGEESGKDILRRNAKHERKAS